MIRSLVRCLEHEYGVKDINGVKWGFRGLAETDTRHWLKLSSDTIQGI